MCLYYIVGEDPRSPETVQSRILRAKRFLEGIQIRLAVVMERWSLPFRG